MLSRRLARLVPCLAVLACGGKAGTDAAEGSGAVAVSECERDSECSSGICLCGYCTRSCESDSECGSFSGSACVPAARVGCSREDSLCLPPNAMADAPEGPTIPVGVPPVDSSDQPTIEPGPSASEPSASVPDMPMDAGTDPVVDSLDECRAEAVAGLGTGSPLLDGYFREVETVTARARELADARTAMLSDMAQALGSDDASVDGVIATYEALVDARTSDGVSLFMWGARCPIAVGDLWQTAALCDPELPPSQAPLDCHGACVVGEGGSCEAGAVECRRTSPDECLGYCEGPCSVPLGPDGTCSGACEGMCRTATTEAECDGVVTCLGEQDAPVPCTLECEGTIDAPATIAGCGDVSQAAVWLDATCTAPTPVPSYEPATVPDAGAATDFERQLTAFLAEFRVALELQEQSNATLQAAAVLSAALADVSAALSATAVDSPCASVLLREAPATLGQAGANINTVMIDTSALLVGIP